MVPEHSFFPIGQIELVCGSMFSGKSEELIRRLKRAAIARQHVQVFKPATDTRSGSSHIVSHNGVKLEAREVKTATEIMGQVEDKTNVIGIDEVQFFDGSIVGVIDRLANMGKRVIVAGLDQDFRGEPFEPVPQLAAIAEYVTKVLAVCVRCGAPANRSQRISPNTDDQVVVGAAEAYEARCRRCFDPNY